MKGGSKLLVCASGIALMACNATAKAQDTGAEDEANDENLIIVSAQKREQSILDVPLTVQAISGDEIAATGIEDAGQLARLIPSASVVSSSSRGFETIQIRGVAAGTTGDGLTGYYVDDFAFGIPNLQLSPPARLLDLEQVEIIRGPSGTLWGQGSMGGNIRLITTEPDTTKFSGKVIGEYSGTRGGADNYAIDGILNIPLVEDVAAIRISGGFDKLGGFADLFQTGEENVNGSRGVNVRVKGLLRPTDRLTARATVWIIDNEQDYSNGLIATNPFTGEALPEPVINGGGSVTNGPVDGFTDTSMEIYSLTLEYEFDGATLTSSTAIIDHELEFEAPLTLAGFNFNNDSLFETSSFTQEIRLASNGGGPFNWIFGGYYRDATIDSDINFFTDLTDLGLGQSPLINNMGRLKTQSWAIFGEASLELFDGMLVPLVGLRYFEDERTAGPGLDRITGIELGEQSTTFDNLSPRFNLSFKPSQDVTLFINVANGFRSGTLQTLDQVAAAEVLGVITTAEVRPDELWTYELGGKFSLAGGNLIAEAGIYQTDWDDVQQPFGAISSVANVGDARIRGIDLALVWFTPLDGFSLRGNVNFQDTEWRTVIPNITLSLPFVTPGSDLLAVPNETFSLSANYEKSVDIFGGSDLSLNATFAHTGDTLQQTGSRTDNLDTLSLNAQIRTASGITFGIFAINLTDEDGATQLDPFAGDAFVRLYPRQIGVRLGFDF
ncbi:MAG: TonB-dependent receptor [Pseudomonadota bacterium]